MAEVILSIGGREYGVACRDGEEPHLTRLGELLDARAQEAHRAVGGVNEARQLLLAGLLLADEVISGSPQAAAPPPPRPSDALATRLEALADRIETIAAGLGGEAGRA